MDLKCQSTKSLRGSTTANSGEPFTAMADALHVAFGGSKNMKR